MGCYLPGSSGWEGTWEGLYPTVGLSLGSDQIVQGFVQFSLKPPRTEMAQGNLYHLLEVMERGLAMTLSSSLTTRGCIPSGPIGVCMSNVP